MNFSEKLYPDTWNSATSMLARSPQALLLHGVGGLGKFNIALELANWLLCKNISAQLKNSYQNNNQIDNNQSHQNNLFEKACGKCASCKLFNTREHLDLQVLYPNAKEKMFNFWWGDFPPPDLADSEQKFKRGKSNIAVDDVRSLDRFINLSSFHGGLRVVIIWPLNMMNASSANALLKNLEEPTPNFIYLLVCDNLDRIPATIISRSRKINITPPTFDKTLLWVKEKIEDNNIGDEEITNIINFVDRVPLEALRWLNYHPLFAKLQISLNQSKWISMLELASEIGEFVNPKSNKITSQQSEYQISLDDLLTIMQKLIFQKLVLIIKAKTDPAKILKWYQIINDLIFYKRHLVYTLNPRQVFESILLKIAILNK